MTEIQPAHYTQGACHTAQGDRLAWASLVCNEGVSNPTDGALEVVPGGGLSININAGGAFVQGDFGSQPGVYHVYNDNAVNLVVDSPDTDTRVDLVVARVYDSQYSGALDEWRLEIVKGLPSPVPVPPALPPSALPLAEITVPPGLAIVAVGNIEDLRNSFEYCGDGGFEGTFLEFSVPGAYSFQKADYPNAKAIKITVTAGGGGGGSAPGGAANESSASGGGGAGGTGIGLIPFEELNSSEPFTVGSGGSGGSNQGGGVAGNGSAGGNSTWGDGSSNRTIVSSGGGGGFGQNATSSFPTVRGGGTGNGTSGSGWPSGNLINFRGGPGGSAVVAGLFDMVSGSGGNSYFGGGGTSRSLTGEGQAGIRGGGGAGSVSRGDESDHRGGNGGDGVVVIEVIS